MLDSGVLLSAAGRKKTLKKGSSGCSWVSLGPVRMRA